jgi:hypothetical protein
MNKETLQAEIASKDGIILSDGTLNLQHLLPSAYDLIVAYRLDEKLAKAIEGVFIGEKPTYYNQFYGETKLNDDKREEAEWIWNEDVYNLFSEIAPLGFYFGCTEGDGACIGFFRYEDNE